MQALHKFDNPRQLVFSQPQTALLDHVMHCNLLALAHYDPCPHYLAKPTIRDSVHQTGRNASIIRDDLRRSGPAKPHSAVNVMKPSCDSNYLRCTNPVI
jgi:hypothetical protein